MDILWSALTFIAISAYYVYMMDARHVVVVAYMFVANEAEPYVTIADQLGLNGFPETCWRILHLCWIFENYDADLTAFFALCC